MTEEEAAIEKARTLFAEGADVIFLALEDDELLVDGEPPDRPGTIVTARSLAEVRRFVRDLKREHKI